MSTSVPKGALYGGQQAIVGAHVYVYAANTTGGYGSAASSLMQSVTGTTQDSSGNYYVTTDAAGAFSYTGSITCPTSTTPIYILALGGDGSGNQPALYDNSAIALTDSLGSCSGVSSSTFAYVNEVTTAAMAYALEAFTVDATHIGSPSTNTTGLLNAFATVANLADSTTGKALSATPAGNGVAPQRALNTIADIVEACVNSAGNTSAACSTLFSHTSTTTGTPADTFAAFHNIAAFPAAQAAALYGDAMAGGDFQPALTTPPTDFALGITFSPTSINAVQPSAVAIDASGKIWMANCQSCLTSTAPDSLLVFDPNGAFLHSYTGSAVPGTQVLHGIKGIAFDASGNNVYTINQGIAGGPAGGIGDDQMIKMDTATGTVQAGFPLDFDQATYGVDTFNGIALDNSGEIWATATNTGAITEVTPSGNLINGSPFFIGGTLGVATDNIGNIWFAGIGGNNIIQFDTNGNFLQNFTPAGLNQPYGMVINGSNELLTINQGSKSLSKVEFFNGNNGPGSPYSNIGIYQATMTAIDGTNQVIIPNCRASCPSSGSTLPDNILRVDQTGVPNTGGSGAAAGAAITGLSNPVGAATDASGNVWVSNYSSGTLTQVVGFASPTLQPLALAATNGKIGQLP